MRTTVRTASAATGGVLAFDIFGKVQNVPDAELDDLSGATLEPTTLSLTVSNVP